ncbi:MAG: hypothetical protein GKC07_00750 [Methanomicrobiales archaeon]|nr:hypothetical protein [Methanomicrobiales archaeon]
MNTARLHDTEEMEYIPATVNDQWNYLLSTIWDQMIHLVIRFDGRLQEPVLASAVMSACRAEPLTTMRFCEGDPPYFTPAPIPVDRIFAVTRAADPDSALRELLTKPLDPAAGPQVRIRLIRSDHDLLCISVNHTISDAYGLKSFGSRIARLYQARSSASPFLTLENTHDRSFGSVLRLFSPAERETAVINYGDQTRSWSLPVRSSTTGDPGYTIVRLNTGILPVIKAGAGRLGATVNDVLLSAFSLALAESVPELRKTPLPVLTSIDLRRYLSPDSFPSLANLSVAFEVPVMAGERDSLATVVRRIHAAMEERKQGHAGIGAAERLCRDFSGGYEAVKQQLRILEQETRDGRREKNPFFANLGVIPESVLDYGAIPVAGAWMLPPVEFSPGFGLAASTCRGSLCLASGYCRDALPEKEVSEILDRMAVLLAHW